MNPEQKITSSGRDLTVKADTNSQKGAPPPTRKRKERHILPLSWAATGEKGGKKRANFLLSQRR